MSEIMSTNLEAKQPLVEAKQPLVEAKQPLTKTFDLRDTVCIPIRYDISSGKTASDLTGGVLKGDEYDKPLIEELVIERLNASVVILKYAIGGTFAKFPTNLIVNHLFDGKSIILEKATMHTGTKEMQTFNSLDIYALCISDNYTVVYNDLVVLTLERECGWYIQLHTLEAENCKNEDVVDTICLNDEPEKIKLSNDFTIERLHHSLATLSGLTKFIVKSKHTDIHPTVLSGNNSYYCVLGFTDDYYTNDFIFTSIRRWRVLENEYVDRDGTKFKTGYKLSLPRKIYYDASENNEKEVFVYENYQIYQYSIKDGKIHKCLLCQPYTRFIFGDNTVYKTVIKTIRNIHERVSLGHAFVADGLVHEPQDNGYLDFEYKYYGKRVGQNECHIVMYFNFREKPAK